MELTSEGAEAGAVLEAFGGLPVVPAPSSSSPGGVGPEAPPAAAPLVAVVLLGGAFDTELAVSSAPGPVLLFECGNDMLVSCFSSAAKPKVC